MTFAADLSFCFTRSVRAQGRALQSRVDFVDGPPEPGEPFDAQVFDNCVRAVWIDPDQFDAGDCTCQGFEDPTPCKHMWAAILAADAVVGDSGNGSGNGSVHGSGNGANGVSVRPMRDAGLEFLPEPLRRQILRLVGPTKTPRPAAEAGAERLEQLLRRQREDDAPGAVMPHIAARVRQVHFGLAPGAGPRCEIRVGLRVRLGNGGWGAWQPLEEDGDTLHDIGLEPADRELVVRLRAEALVIRTGFDGRQCEVAELAPATAADLVAQLAATGRLFALVPSPGRRGPETAQPIRVADGDPIRVRCVVAEAANDRVALRAEMFAGDTVVPAGDLFAVVGDHALVLGDALHRFVTAFPVSLVRDLLQVGPLVVAAKRRAELEALLRLPPPPKPAAPATCRLRLHESLESARHGRLVRGVLEFDYGDMTIAATDEDAVLAVDGGRVRRDVDREREWLDRFVAGGGIMHWELGRPATSVPAAQLVPCIEQLLAAGFEIHAARDRVRSLGSPHVSVRTGIDWFDVGIERADGGAALPLPDLLAAIASQKSGYVRLGSGELGLVGKADLHLLRSLAKLGKTMDEEIRIPKSRGFLLDAMLEAQDSETVRVDARFAALRERKRVRAVARTEPKGFGATLRPYQREGLGWFRFLQDLGVSGCLADDMGLGKTVQVLALLEQQRRRRPHPGASLVVAPRSLVFHWEREAQRFAPKLRVLTFVGTGRFETYAEDYVTGFAGFDIVMTTYGTLRNDVSQFEDIEWNYVVLDEAQAIKNERSQVSKAARLCRAKHRLALSGTPVENHLGELWSLFEFLNPGMLGASRTFRSLLKTKIAAPAPAPAPAPALAPAAAGGDAAGDDAAGGDGAGGAAAGNGTGPDPSFAAVLRNAVRPFLLRRTKEQVLTELPPKSEQTIECELPPKQRRSYEELAAHFRTDLLGGLDEQKVPDEMRFQVLEALLRLRQTACHPGLIDPARAGEPCAKFEALLPMLEEMREEGHKAIVFSQFPTFLRLLRDRLEPLGFAYAYLDGRTRKRSAQVDRFQTDPDCPLFLISLKAGGHGLNLTAASYVFLLDPWWNPAVEAQAIDRTHRIGQDKNVHAYRLICRGTVEERVAELQESKRALARTVLGDDQSVLQGLTGADVARLLQ